MDATRSHHPQEAISSESSALSANTDFRANGAERLAQGLRRPVRDEEVTGSNPAK